MRFLVIIVLSIVMFPGCRSQSPAATPDEAKQFLDEVNATMLRLGIEQGQAGWVAETYITEDTEALNARVTQAYIDAVARYAKAATRFDNVELPPDLRRQLTVLKLSLVLATPADPKLAEELTRLAAGLSAAYGKGKWCPAGSKAEECLDVEKITEIMATSRDPARLRQVWEGWHTISIPMRKDYQRFVELANTGARAGLRRYRGALAPQVRHAGRPVHQGTGSFVGTGAAVVRVAPRIRPDEAPRKVR